MISNTVGKEWKFSFVKWLNIWFLVIYEVTTTSLSLSLLLGTYQLPTLLSCGEMTSLSRLALALTVDGGAQTTIFPSIACTQQCPSGFLQC